MVQAGNRRWRARLGVALAYSAIAAPLVFLLIAAIARRWIADDGFINLRVARNILLGHGPVFNVGERVEAFTSPLWIAVLVALGALRVRLEIAAAAAGIALGLAGCALAVRGSMDVHGAPRPWRRAVLDAPYLPFGMIVFCALSPVWDFLSSGLENGLSYAWLGSCSAVVARLARSSDDASNQPLGRLGLSLAAFLVGLGPLVRPDLSLSAGMFAFVLFFLSLRGRSRRGALASGATVLASAAFVPGSYQLFRMGYYASTVPNTALAKEAFLSNWQQGANYAQNFFGTYHFAWPLGAVLVLATVRLRTLLRDRRLATAGIVLGTQVAGLASTFYVVRVGGDFMHARMLLPPIFLVLSPVWCVPLSTIGSLANDTLAIRTHLLTLAAVWAAVAAAGLRPPHENQYGIGDERRWYATSALHPGPVLLEHYAQFGFYLGADTILSALSAAEHAPGTRGAVLVDEDAFGSRLGAIQTYPIAPGTVGEGVLVAAARIPIGIVGWRAGPRVHLVDRAGLADPIAARLVLTARGRPGHEKNLSNAWFVARYTDVGGPDSTTQSARRALQCGTLRTLDDAVRAPMTWSRFAANVRLARSLAELRIPTDPWQAEQRFCTATDRWTDIAGGPGGLPFRIECPANSVASALEVALAPGIPAIVQSVAIVCRSIAHTAAEPLLGAIVGRERAGGAAGWRTTPLECNEGEVPTGLHGSAAVMVDRVGVVCSSAARGIADAPTLGAPTAGRDLGGTGGASWMRACPARFVLVGVAGRSGDLVDAIGPVCASVDSVWTNARP